METWGFGGGGGGGGGGDEGGGGSGAKQQSTSFRLQKKYNIHLVIYILEVLSFGDGLVEFNEKLMKRQPNDNEK